MNSIGTLIGKVLIATGWVVLATGIALAQKREGDGEYENVGPISVSQNYDLAEDGSFIIFRLRNNTTRTINNMYAWVYRFNQAPNGKPFNFFLMNNPHRGGTIIEGGPHLPNGIADWRFPMIRGILPTGQNEKYTLRVSLKAIFFPVVEPSTRIQQTPP